MYTCLECNSSEIAVVPQKHTIWPFLLSLVPSHMPVPSDSVQHKWIQLSPPSGSQVTTSLRVSHLKHMNLRKLITKCSLTARGMGGSYATYLCYPSLPPSKWFQNKEPFQLPFVTHSLNFIPTSPRQSPAETLFCPSNCVSSLVHVTALLLGLLIHTAAKSTLILPSE